MLSILALTLCLMDTCLVGLQSLDQALVLSHSAEA
jgi:hypothetical protein